MSEPLLKIASVSTRAGDDPDAFDHASEVYADWPEVFEHCVRSHTGQHQYGPHDGHARCIHCGQGEGCE